MHSADIPEIALSVRQPWAWALIHGGKDVENRTKIAITNGRMTAQQRISIHASKGMTRDEYESAARFIENEIGIGCPRPDELIRGAIIGTIDVIDIINNSDSKWFFGPWALEVEFPHAIEPIPAVGALGFFKWKPGGELEQPKPWMKSWPDRPKKAKPSPPETPRLI